VDWIIGIQEKKDNHWLNQEMNKQTILYFIFTYQDYNEGWVYKDNYLT
jgi:hypothetical protein